MSSATGCKIIHFLYKVDKDYAAQSARIKPARIISRTEQGDF